MRYPIIVCLAVFLFTLPVLEQTTLHVPGDYPSIQRAVNVAVNGDTVLVAPGTYFENIEILAKQITVKSSHGPQSTVIDGSQNGSVVTIDQGSGPDMSLEGFTIQNGYANHGGGIASYSSFPTIRFNIIRDNESTYSMGGGGIFCSGGSLGITSNILCDNTAYERGGGISVYSSEAFIINNIIYGNYVWASLAGEPPTANTYGGGIATFFSSSSAIVNNTIYNNTADGDYFTVIPNGGGVYSQNAVPLTNCILWSNTGGGQADGYIFTSNINYCNIEGGTTHGTNNIDTNPRFKDAANNDFHLLAQSPCVDMGFNPAVGGTLIDFDGNARILDGHGDNASLVDMGADEFMMIRADPPTIDESTGGSVNFFLDAGPDDAYRTYLILGSLTGTSPGSPLPQGHVILPLNWDFFTDIVWDYKTTLIFSNFLGTLNDIGRAQAQFNVGPLPPGSAGTIIYFAFTCNKPFNLASHPVEVLVVP